MTSESLSYRPCVGIMVLNRSGLVWIGRRHDAPGEPEGPGTWWQMPQGGIDGREDPAKAALRELEEETGIRSVAMLAESQKWYTYDLPEDLRPSAWDGRYRGQKQKWFVVRFLGSDHEVAIIRPGHTQEFDAWRWSEIGELLELIVPFKRALYAELLRDFGHLAKPQS